MIVKTEDDLNRTEVRKFIKPLPDDPRQIERMAALCPKYVESSSPERFGVSLTQERAAVP